MIWTETILFCVLALGLSLFLNRVMISLAPKLGLVDTPGERRIHKTVIPRAGGLAIWVAFMVTVSVALLATGGGLPDGQLTWRGFGAFAAGSAVLVATGLVDDRIGLRPLVKLGAHVLAPVAMFALNPVRVGLFPDHWSLLWDLLVFVIWSVVLINAFNLIDGLDGLCGGLATVACSALAALAVINGRYDTAILLAIMAMCLVGFLWFNMNPARIFLGDAGSMLLGFFLATAATGGLGRKTVLGVVLLPIAIAGVPMMDVLLALWRRWMKKRVGALRGDDTKRGLFDADREHLHHRMLDEHGSQKKVAVTLQILAALVAALCLLPLLFGDQMLRFSLVGALILGLAIMRHFARVELEHTGEVLHLAIKMPNAQRRLAVILVAYDLLVLLAAGFGALVVETNVFVREDGWDAQSVMYFLDVFVVSGMLGLFGAKVHKRLWVRATVRDFLSITFWLMLAGAVTFCIVSLGKASIEWSVLRATMIACLGSCALVCLPRLTLDTVREIALVHRVGGRSSNDSENTVEQEPMVVVGAGDLGTLFLEHLKASSRDAYRGMRILGFIDKNQAFHGRLLRSFLVLGGISVLRELAEEGKIKGVVVAINDPQTEMVEELEALAREHKLKIHWWKVSLKE
ncbi:MAG: hypothetical protein ACKO2G_00420 [Verrucomicrobiales bacterium]